MSRIEELPDDFDESLNLNASNPASPTPVKPPSNDVPHNDPPAAVVDTPETKTAAEILDMMRKTPLFMTNLDDAEAGTPSSRHCVCGPAI
jgi:hypothetical protein